MAGELSPLLDGTKVVADAAAREAVWPLATRPQNARVYRIDTGTVERWVGSVWADALQPSLPAGSRTTTTLAAYLANNAVFNVLDYAPLVAGVPVVINTGLATTAQTEGAFTAAVAAARLVNGKVRVPSGTYNIASLTLTNCNRMEFQWEGAMLRGQTSGSYPHILRIDSDSPEVFFTGAILLDGVCNTGYTTACMVASAYNKLANVYFTRCALCWKFDRDNSVLGERGVSEITITGGHSYACLRIIEALGANTLINFNGFIASTGLLTDAVVSDLPGGIRPAAWDAADSTTIRAIGAVLFFSGTHLTNVRGTALIDCRPILTTDPNYQSPYGRAYVTNSNVEASVLGGTTNPGAVASPDDTAPALVFDNCQGSVGGNVDWCTLDSTFKGAVKFRNCGFYSPNGISRGAYIVNSASTAAHVYVEEGSFGRGFSGTGHGGGLNAYRGGIVHFLHKMILQYTTSAQSIPTAQTVVNFTTAIGNGNTDRFHAGYAAGVFTVPAGGLQDVTVEATVSFASAVPNADVAITKNGSAYKYAPNSAGATKSLVAFFPSLAAGDTISMTAGTNGASVALDGTTFNRLVIMASNP